jgi:hypothetical protein
MDRTVIQDELSMGTELPRRTPPPVPATAFTLSKTLQFLGARPLKQARSNCLRHLGGLPPIAQALRYMPSNGGEGSTGLG